MNTKNHWEYIYETKAPMQVSWYQEHARYSLQFIQNTGVQKTDHIIDIGGGASTLVDDLIAAVSNTSAFWMFRQRHCNLHVSGWASTPQR